MEQFNKAFIDVVNYLLKNKRDLRITSLQNLMSSLGFDQGSRFYDIRDGKRHIDAEKRDEIVDILSKKYSVRKDYFKTLEGPILSKPLNIMEMKAQKYTNCMHELKEALIEIEKLKYQLSVSIKMNKFLEQQVDDYRKIIEKFK